MALHDTVRAMASVPALAALDPRDRAFARALVMATLRHLGAIDSALQSKVKKAPPDRVVQILRLGVAQIFVLQTPAHAAVANLVSAAVRLIQPRSPSPRRCRRPRLPRHPAVTTASECR